MKIKFSAILIIILIMSIFSGCDEESAIEDKLPLVKTQRVGQTNINSESVYSGTVKGRYETNLAFQVGGQILSRNPTCSDCRSFNKDFCCQDCSPQSARANAIRNDGKRLYLAEYFYSERDNYTIGCYLSNRK